jgi:hypothetical protein
MKKSAIFFFLLSSYLVKAKVPVVFESLDGKKVYADWYPTSSEAPSILLCHQANSNRGEYATIALKLNKYGFNCLAIDQRLGANDTDYINQSSAALPNSVVATEAMAKDDIGGAIQYLYNLHQKKIIVWGSGYSANLILSMAQGENNIMAALAFSPLPNHDSNASLSKLRKSCFITSSKAEAAEVTNTTREINSLLKVQYIPTSEGAHGAKSLWQSIDGHEQYWIATMSFLNRIKREFDLNK